MDFCVDDVADEVVGVLSAADISAELDFTPELELPESEERRVIVTPAGLTGEVANRTEDQEDHTIHVGVIVRVGKKCSGDDVREQLSFVRSIRDLFKRQRLATTRVTLVAFVNDPIYRDDILRDQGLFVSVLRLTFRGFR